MGIFWNVPVQVMQDEKCSVRISPVVSMCSNGRNIWMAKCFILDWKKMAKHDQFDHLHFQLISPSLLNHMTYHLSLELHEFLLQECYCFLIRRM
nr:hypothetical protein Iba_chr14eCG5250 [Ipomoea batatas]